MRDPNELLTADQLLKHRAFLHALARGLLGDEQLAEDVVQDAYVAALKRPPHGTNLRGWLARVTRNLSLMTRRSLGRRTRHEAHAVGGNAVPAADEAIERVEVQRKVVDAVLRLDEPYRTTIVLRYFEDRTPAEIAEHQSVAVKTVYTRVQRALKKLRVDLDRTHDGRRGAWALPLAGMAAPSAATASVGATSLAVAVGLGAVLFVWQATRDEDESAAPPRHAAASRSEPVRGEEPMRAADTPVNAPADTRRATRPTVGEAIAGHVLDTDGEPVRHAIVSIDIEEDPRPAAWLRIAKRWDDGARVDEHGRFRIEGVLRGTYRLTAEVSYADAFGTYSTRKFVQAGVAAGTESVEFRVPPPFRDRRVRVALKIVGPGGAPIEQGSVAIWPAAYSKLPFAVVEFRNGTANIDIPIPSPAPIRYVIEPTQAEPMILHAILEEQEVATAGAAPYEVRLASAKQIRGIVMHNGSPASFQLYIEKLDGSWDTPRFWIENHHSVVSGKDGRFTVPGLVPGRFAVRSADDKFATRTRVEVAAGDHDVIVHIVPSTAPRIQGRILPPPGARFEQLSWGLRRIAGPGPGSFGGSTTTFNPRFGQEKTFDFAQVHGRARYHLWSRAKLRSGDWLAPAEMEVTADGAPIELRMQRSPPVLGVVVREDGTPVAGIDVYALARATGVKSGVDGTFRLTGLPPGKHRLSIASTELLAREDAPLVAPGTTGARLVVVPRHSIVGRITDPHAGALDFVTLQAWRPGATSPTAKMTVEHDGSFKLDVPPGRFHLLAFDSLAGRGDRYALLDDVPAGKRDLTLRLKRGSSMRGVVVNEAGDPVKNATVWVSGAWGRRSVASGSAQGAFGFSSLPRGPYRMWVAKQGKTSIPVEAEAGVTSITLLLE